uniref:Apple domain-containing protein n=1 Tax=Meloidogyne hapla TaxID=6305 RepID=A0A1I8BNC0_MELHA
MKIIFLNLFLFFLFFIISSNVLLSINSEFNSSFIECPADKIFCPKYRNEGEKCKAYLLCYESQFGINENDGLWKPHERFIVEKNKNENILCQKCIEEGKCKNWKEYNNWNGILISEKDGGVEIKADIFSDKLVFKYFFDSIKSAQI